MSTAEAGGKRGDKPLRAGVWSHPWVVVGPGCPPGSGQKDAADVTHRSQRRRPGSPRVPCAQLHPSGLDEEWGRQLASGASLLPCQSLLWHCLPAEIHI